MSGSYENFYRLVTPWKVVDMINAVLIVVVALGTSLIIVSTTQITPDSKTGILFLGLSTGAALGFAAWLMGPTKYNIPISSLGITTITRIQGTTMLLTLGALAASLALTFVYTGTIALTGWDILPTPELSKYLILDGAWIIISFSLIVLWAPLAEEIFFRGFIFAGLRTRIGSNKAILCSALLFSLFHIDPRVMIPTFLSGIVLAALYNRCGHVWGPFVAHSAQNCIAFITLAWIIE